MNVTMLIRCRMTDCPLDLGDTWHHGPPISPRWAGGLEPGTDDHSENTAEEECDDWSSDELGRGGGKSSKGFHQ